MKGHPKYKIGDSVCFSFGDETLCGIVFIVDRYGAIGCDDVSYDIFIESKNTLYKHIEEKYVFTKEE